ncbi:MAG TPA: HD domain-containing protein [Steroidobacteraceae bacterium]|nr:HD domain-containing protein [Steroidobacteraceae bacterium]
MSIADDIFAIFDRRGSGAYFGEHVSMTEHALQAAYFARQESAPAVLVLAALLHDIGHLVEDVPDDLAGWSVDARHEEIGARWLARRFRAEVSEPVRLHVPAKRYLCATDPNYVAMLSQASVVTLKLQGGPMGPGESLQFETQRYFREAIQVRRCDDQGKVAGLNTPGLAEYRGLIEQFALRG